MSSSKARKLCTIQLQRSRKASTSAQSSHLRLIDDRVLSILGSCRSSGPIFLQHVLRLQFHRKLGWWLAGSDHKLGVKRG